MEEFNIPLKPEDLARPSVREDEYRVENEVHPELMKEKDVVKLLDDIEGRLLPNSTHQMVSHKNFDVFYGFLAPGIRRQLLDLLLRGIGHLTQAVNKLITTEKESLEPEEYSHRLLVHKNALKMYTFLLTWLISSLEKSSAAAAELKPKGKGAGGKKKKADEDSDNFWDAESLKESVLSALVHVLEVDLSRVWNLALPEEAFLNAFSNVMCTLLENSANCKLKSARRCIFVLLGILVQRYKQAGPLTNALFHRLHNHEHLAPVLAQLLEVLCKEYDSPQVVGDFLREISRMNSKDVPQDSASVRNISTFIGELAEVTPQQVLANVSLLLVHLDSESYTMRNGVIHMVGRLLASNLFEGQHAAENAQTRDSLFKILEDRFRDMNAFCRSKTLQTWSYLLSLHSQQRRIIPLKVLPNVTRLTIGRLEDKGARVREHAIQLLTTLLEANPFGPALKLTEFRVKFEEAKKAVVDHEAKETAPPSDGAANAEKEKAEKEREAEREKLARTLQYFEDSTHFIEQLHGAVPVLGRLLGSKVNADVLETISFFVSATQFQLECAAEGTRKMLPLIWSREAPIRDAVTVAYERLYANLATVPSKAGAMHVAKNLIKLTEGATLAEITSLEELVAMMMAKRSIPPPVIYLLWEIFGLKVPEAEASDSRGALVILSMIASSSPEMVKEKLPVLLGQGLGPRWKEDELLAKYTCVALQRLNDRGDKNAQPTPRMRADHEMFGKLSDVIKDSSPRTQWYSAAEQAVAAVYKLHERPDDLCSSLIKEMAGNLFDDTTPKKISSAELSKFVFVLGHVALKQLVHIEEIQSEMRRRREANEKVKEGGGKDKENQEKDKQLQKKKKSAIEEELGLVHGVTDETEADRLREVAERELVGKSLLGQFGALIVRICAAPDKYPNPMLRTSAVLALCKFMCVSEPFCREQLPLLFTLLEQSEDSAIRSNIVIAVGDMSLRFPNLVEPWTPNIYARLRDKDARVKKNALMVLMHLILNDMIKVKGQVYEMAICMESDDQRISDLARLFFSELSRKGNHLYNILPDVISHLSVAPNLSSESFKSIMKYLLAFIEKDKQTEALVEKLCHRFKNPAQDTVRTAEAEVTHARDVAFCLTVLNYNERVLKKLAECFKLYADKLVDDEVYQCVQQVLAKGRKSSLAKAETKTVIDELAARVEQAHNTGVVDGRPIEGLKKPPSVRAKPAAAKKAARGQKAKAKAKHSDEEELLSLSEDEDDDLPMRSAAPAPAGEAKGTISRAAPARRAAVKAKAKARPTKESDSGSGSEKSEAEKARPVAPKRRVVSDDDDSAGEPAPKLKAKGGAKRKAKAKAAPKDDSDSDAGDAALAPRKDAGGDEEEEEAPVIVRKAAARKGGRKQVLESDESD